MSDITAAYFHAGMEGKDEVLMTLRGPLAELMALSAPEVYRDYVTLQGGKKVLYVRLQRALYGMLKSALLFYRKLCGDLKRMGFELNPYDPCVANKVVNGNQLTVCWHVDDVSVAWRSGSRKPR